MLLISWNGSISKWPPRWIYYNIHTYISHKEVHFAYIKTYYVLLSVANSTGNVNTGSSIAGARNPWTLKTQNSQFFSFSAKALLCNNAFIVKAVRVNLEKAIPTGVQETQRLRYIQTATYRKRLICSRGCHIYHVVSNQSTNEILQRMLCLLHLSLCSLIKRWT